MSLFNVSKLFPVRFTLALSLAVGILITYSVGIAEHNSYMGYKPISIDFTYGLLFFLSCLVTATMMPRAIHIPSDYFCFVYSIFALIPYFSLYKIRGDVDTLTYVLNFLILSLPLVTIRITRTYTTKIRMIAAFSQKSILKIGALFIIAITFYGLVKGAEFGGFSLESSYERRMSGRTTFSAGSIMAYANGMAINGLGPYIAFLAALRKNKALTGITFLVGVAFFYIIGTKAPVLNLVLAHLLGLAARNNKIKDTHNILFALILLLFLCSFSELFFYDYSIIADFFIRRSFTVPPLLLSAYFDLINNNTGTSWGGFSGINDARKITFFVGEYIFGYDQMNANTNAFIYELTSNGVGAFAFTITLVTTFFFLLNSIYKKTKDPALLYIGFLYSILIVEQSATTALLTSGVGLLLFLNYSTKRPKVTEMPHDKNN